MASASVRTKRLTAQTLLLTILILQDFIPALGNIPIGPLSLTTLQITVMIGAVVMGPNTGMLLGGTWGVITWLRAFFYPSSPLAPLIFTNPIIAIVPRLLVGLVAGWLFIWLRKLMKDRWALIIVGAIGAMTNTILVLGGIYLFAHTPAVAKGYHTDVAHLGTVLGTALATNGLAEMVLSMILVPAIAIPLLRYTHFNDRK